MACFWSHKFGKVEPDGFQYCLTCQMARKPEQPHCVHEWETVKEIELARKEKINYESVMVKYGFLYVLRCKKCGQIDSKNVKI